MRHQWGCNCPECANRGRAALREAQAVREHNRSYYATGTRVWIPPASQSFDHHYAYDWMTQPKPGELEYLQ